MKKLENYGRIDEGHLKEFVHDANETAKKLKSAQAHRESARLTYIAWKKEVASIKAAYTQQRDLVRQALDVLAGQSASPGKQPKPKDTPTCAEVQDAPTTGTLLGLPEVVGAVK